ATGPPRAVGAGTMTSKDVVVAVIDALGAAGVAFMLVGSFSTNRYGIPRSTKDADFVVELGDTTIASVARHFPPGVRLDPQLSFETVTMTRKFEATVEGSPFTVELFLLSRDEHDLERFRRRRDTLLGREVDLPTPEDLIITKLRWGRPKDLDDARDVI